jgi:predicted nucleotidyltransferase
VIHLQHSLQQAAALLDREGLPWALMGGWAVSIRTEPRFTRDVDVAIAVDSDRRAEAVIASFRAIGFTISAVIEQTAVDRLATVRLTSNHLLLDLMFASSGIEAELCARADRLEVLPSLVLPVVCSAHLLALKLLARDDSTRPQDAADIRNLLQALRGPDWALTKEALSLITTRGYHRGRDLLTALERATREFGIKPPTL